MFLKSDQIKVVGEFKRFFQTARETKDAIETARKALPENLRHTLNWVQNRVASGFKNEGLEDLVNKIKKSDNEDINRQKSYITRRFTYVIENPFLARKLAGSCLKVVEEKINEL